MTVAGSYFPAESIDHDLVEQAAALQPLLAASASRCENQRRIPDENLAALDAAELFSTMVPKRVGGHGAKLATQLAVSAELARGCASTAWVQTLLNVGTWAASLLVTEGQSDVFTDGRPPRVCGVLTPTGTARPTDGGYLVNGRWGFASGSLHADWCTGGVIVLDDDGNEVGQDVAYMPIGEVTIEDTWYVAGMRGTGSNTLVASDIFVPTHRFALTGHVSGTPTPLADQEPSDRWPLGAVLALVLLGPILGIAAAALDTVITKAEKRAISYTTYAARPTRPSCSPTSPGRASTSTPLACTHSERPPTSPPPAPAATSTLLPSVGSVAPVATCARRCAEPWTASSTLAAPPRSPTTARFSATGETSTSPPATPSSPRTPCTRSTAARSSISTRS
jgi:hypothetical protein